MSASPPKPSSLPPARAVHLPNRGTTWIHDSGPSGKPAVLLLHGWTSTAALNWYKCFPALSADYRVVAMDHRGHGRGIRSRIPFRLEHCADDAAALISELGIGPAIVVGYSMGGPIAQLVWRRHREQVEGLVLCATATRLTARQQLSGPVSTLGLGASMALSLLPTGVRRRGMHLATRNWSANNQAAAWAANEWSRHDPSALIQAGLALSRFDSREWISELDVPVAVVVTTNDQVVPPSWQWSMSRMITGAVTYPVDGDHRACVNEQSAFVPALLSACGAVQRRSAPA